MDAYKFEDVSNCRSQIVLCPGSSHERHSARVTYGLYRVFTKLITKGYTIGGTVDLKYSPGIEIVTISTKKSGLKHIFWHFSLNLFSLHSFNFRVFFLFFFYQWFTCISHYFLNIHFIFGVILFNFCTFTYKKFIFFANLFISRPIR